METQCILYSAARTSIIRNRKWIYNSISQEECESPLKDFHHLHTMPGSNPQLQIIHPRSKSVSRKISRVQCLLQSICNKSSHRLCLIKLVIETDEKGQISFEQYMDSFKFTCKHILKSWKGLLQAVAKVIHLLPSAWEVVPCCNEILRLRSKKQK